MGQQGLRAGFGRFFRYLRRIGSGERDRNSTLYGSSEESTLVNCDAICHIQRLPDPVLGAIFALSKDAEKEECRAVFPVERIVSQVAVRWRVVALGLPELWSSVDARVRAEHQRALLEWYLAHSEDRPLYVSICLSKENWDVEGKLVLADVLAEVLRLRRLCIRTDSLQVEAAVLEACRMLHAPILEHLSYISLEVPHSFREPEDYICEENFRPVIFKHGVPNLKVLRLQHLEKALYPPLQSVTTLHLEEYNCPAMVHSRFVALLHALPALAHLSLYGSVIADWPVAGTLHLPHLHSLRVASTNQAGRMLLALDAPVLEFITLKDVRSAELQSSLRRENNVRLAALRTLVVDGWVSASALNELFCQLANSVEELRVVNCEADEALNHFPRQLPGLKKIMIHRVRCVAALDDIVAAQVALSLHVDVPWAGVAERWTRLPPWPVEADADADDLFMQLR
ncbi:hypothetical protein R3P38DRAFT_1172680 [Favolaschia claudopus]|uniref:F-box domain-containing protein n=1 Tax=Favolaschia claudopus TaxID=2862362 RepID=A0AAW0E1C4_9AGAR